MKIRQGFVSNSSSSSFILLDASNNEKCPTCGRTDFNMITMLENESYKGDDTYLIASGKDAILKSIEYDYQGYDSTIFKITNILSPFSNKDNLIYCSVSNHNTLILDEIECNKKIKVIYNFD